MSRKQDTQPSRIIGIQFSMASPEEIRRNSVVHVESRDTFIGNKPCMGGLFDSRMGVLESGLICPTDGLTYIDTPGYFGHIELARPVFFIQHIKEIMKIARCICFKCSKLLLNKNQHKHILELSSEERWEYVAPLAAKIKRCGDSTDNGCGCKQPDSVKLEGMGTIHAIWEKIEPQRQVIKITPEHMLKIFRRISDDDISFMGFSPAWSRPEWMICQVLPVPPPAVRPSVKHDAQQRSEDDLTHIYSNIIKTNRDLNDKIQNNANPMVIDQLTMVLQYLIAMIVNNKVKGAVPMAQRNGRPLQCIRDRLDSKSGRVRGNLMGKRVDFSARSVITGDPNLSLKQLGVPLKIAKNITKPVTVNARNMNFLMMLIQNGPEVHPGAKMLERKNGEMFSLRNVDRASIKLEHGDIVHRHMMDGDAVLFNRQPSLHRMSMMCHIVKIMKQGDTFRMNVCCTKPYNADFDGDEMNMHMPQNVLAETELRHLAATPWQMISPSGNSPIIGIYQDSLLGSYRFTRPNLKVSPRDAMNLLMMYPKVDVHKLREAIKDDTVSTFDVLSQIISPITLKYKTKLFEEEEDQKLSNNVLEIRNGKYIRGQIEKGVLGASTKGIIHRICNDYGNMAAASFIDDIQNIVTEYMKSSSFSVGISDLIANKKTQESILQIIHEKKHEVQSVIDKVHLGIFENNTSSTNMKEFETKVNNLLNKATDLSGKEGRKSLSKQNRFLMIVNSGSKGSLVNISQMISCLGQQNVDGQRIPYGYDNRTLPHFCKFDDSPTARGFIENSYISGLTAPELFFHAMGGRIGLIDTACKSVTWETPIIIIENNEPKYIEIGKWIDQRLEANKASVKHYTERQMELLDLDDPIYIPTTDENGIITWGEVTAMTRHDPGNQLYEIVTSGGRKVIVTESKSLLIWDSKTSTLKETSTPDITVGDFVPVNGELCQPPVMIESIDMTKYFPKSEYVYGTDFNMATDEMCRAMQTRNKIPAGWWKENNGKLFTLPYSKKASLQRTNTRSNTDSIKNGYIYPYHANRVDALIPEQFPLNEENGIFIGLFLAEGNCWKSSVKITNNNENIRTFVKNWFEKHSIKCVETQKINKIGGLTTTITANSGILAKFLTVLCGHGAANKHIPTEAFIASDEFIIGLLNGYYSGDGTVTKNSVDVGSASYRLIEGVSMLCSRLGIYGSIKKRQLKKNNLNTQNIKPTYTLRISANWGQTFAEKITLLEEKRNERLKQMKWRKTHMNYKSYNNIVLDKIVEINLVDVKDHPKVYDLTIPSTLNFGLSNGLQVRDTSSTGYIQRRLIKGLEDAVVGYDLTVRNNKGRIIQFAYGDDGFDSTKVENQTIPLTGMTIEDVYMHYDIIGVNDEKSELLGVYEKGTITRLRKQRNETVAKCKTYIERMLEARRELVEKVFHFKDDTSVKVPVAFQYMIANIQGQLNLNANSTVDITPLEAFELIEKQYSILEGLHYAKPTALFRILYDYYLSPKDLLINKRFHRKALIYLLENIVLKYKQAIVNPGEMVGVIAGQSIGEPTTQLTLNSVTYETEIIIRNENKEVSKVSIGDFIQEQIKYSNKIEFMEDKDTTYAELCDKEHYYEVPSANESGETVWRRIEAVTKHPVINEDGTDTMLKITTKGCREVIATKAKSFLQLVDGKIIGVEGKGLKVGDYLPVSKKEIEFKPKYQLDLREMFSPMEYLYGNEYIKARDVMNQHNWWKKHNNTTFVLPHSRSDSFVSLAKANKPILEDCVYMKLVNKCDYRIPEKIQLDYDFGYLIGAYCAEGCMTKHQISISNNNIDYLKPIERICEKYNITTKVYKVSNKIETGWTSQDIRIYSTLLCNIISELCGKLSHNKRVSEKIVFSNSECIMGFLDAYIAGDGCIAMSSYSKNPVSIDITSVSLNMLTDVMSMLKNIGITSYIHKPRKIDKNNRGSQDIKQHYILQIKNKQSQILGSLLKLPIQEKQQKIEKLLKQSFMYEYNKEHLTIPNIIDGVTYKQPRNNLMPDLIFDEIISIEEVQNTTSYAYDLTVEDTRNFDIYNGICMRDTFHLAGVASKSNVTRGVPRIEEILRLTKNPKNPSLTIVLKPIDETDQDKAMNYGKMLEHTKLIDVVKSVQIYFDPIEDATIIEEDKQLIEQFYEFEKFMQECTDENDIEESNQQPKVSILGGGSKPSEYQASTKSKWIIRLEINEEKLLDKNITMDDIHFAITNGYPGDIKCAYSDYNAGNLVFRIRMNSDIFKKKSSGADSLDQSDKIFYLKSFQDTLLNNVVLRGVSGIQNVLPRKLQNTVILEDGKYVKKDTWVLDTTGSNLLEILGNHLIDGNRTFCNDIKEVYDVLGIEAARQVIYNEFVDVMEFSDVYINYHHLSLLCDRMTMTKNMVPIFRSGILKDDIGPIAKATFEMHTEGFLNAARHGEFDSMCGVSANVMCGQYGKYGTNAFNVLLDMKEMVKLKVDDIIVKDTLKEIEKQFGFTEESTGCSQNEIMIRNNISAIHAEPASSVCDDNYEFG